MYGIFTYIYHQSINHMSVNIPVPWTLWVWEDDVFLFILRSYSGIRFQPFVCVIAVAVVVLGDYTDLDALAICTTVSQIKKNLQVKSHDFKS